MNGTGRRERWKLADWGRATTYCSAREPHRPANALPNVRRPLRARCPRVLVEYAHNGPIPVPSYPNMYSSM
jgi:hypothetical protein